jgi:deazaflavin-dependent oxidoreductase (nitroreductase family)
MSRPDPLDRQVIAEFRARGGVVGATGDLSLLLLHHVGAKSGTERVTPLAYWPVTADSVVVLASNRGARTHPHWYHNLVANPITMVEIGEDSWTVRARIAHGKQRRTLISAITAQSTSAAAAVKHAPREIPVVILELLEKREPPARHGAQRPDHRGRDLDHPTPGLG